MKYFALIFVLSFLIACDGGNSSTVVQPVQKPASVVVPPSVSNEDKIFFNQFYPKLENVCPGLKQYASTLNFVGIEHNYNTDFIFSVPDDIKVLPLEWMVSGHTCYFGITKDNLNLSVSKLPCKSLCLGKEIKEGSDIDLTENLVIPLN